MSGILVALHIVVGTLLIIIILLQPSTKSSGFGSSLSGGYTANSAFGARGPVPFLMKLTYWLAAGIMFTSLMLEIGIIKKSRSILDRNLVTSVISDIAKPDATLDTQTPEDSAGHVTMDKRKKLKKN